jgi:hypothetical protein
MNAIKSPTTIATMPKMMPALALRFREVLLTADKPNIIAIKHQNSTARMLTGEAANAPSNAIIPNTKEVVARHFLSSGCTFVILSPWFISNFQQSAIIKLLVLYISLTYIRNLKVLTGTNLQMQKVSMLRRTRLQSQLPKQLFHHLS